MQGKRNKTIISRITENRNFGLLLGLAVLLIIAAIVTPSMYSLNSILSMLQNNAVFGLLALGEMVVIITAGIDISIGASLSLAGVVCCRFMAENPEIPAVVWVVVAMLVGALCGAINGILVGYLKMVPMIATLGTMYIFRGLSFLLSDGEWWFHISLQKDIRRLRLKKLQEFRVFCGFWCLPLFLQFCFWGIHQGGEEFMRSERIESLRRLQELKSRE